MDIKELKSMLKNSTAVLIVEDGEPSVVIVDYQSYKKMNDHLVSHEANGAIGHGMAHIGSEIAQRQPDPEILEKINKEILALKSEIENEEKKMVGVD